MRLHPTRKLSTFSDVIVYALGLGRLDVLEFSAALRAANRLLQASESEHCTVTAGNGMLFPLPSPNLYMCCSSALRVR